MPKGKMQLRHATFAFGGGMVYTGAVLLVSTGSGVRGRAIPKITG